MTINKIDKDFLKKHNACSDGFKFWCKNCEGKKDITQIKILLKHRFDWANWLLVKRLKQDDRRRYAIFAAKQVLHIFENEYPTDSRPRKAILNAEKYLKCKTLENKNATITTANNANATAVYVAYASNAAYAAYASNAAYAAAYAAYAAINYDSYAITTANFAYATSDASHKLKTKIINYGLSLI